VNTPETKTAKSVSWTLTDRSFASFLAWLDDGADSNGGTYLEMRRRLVAYFDRKNCLEPDDLADETLNRVARRLEEEGKIITESPAKYCYIVARYVFLESLRSNRSKDVQLEESAPSHVIDETTDSDEKGERERLLDCLESCCNKLDPPNRDLILRYYHGKERVKIENRRRIAGELGISMNALSIRACRIREKLEVCVKKCASGIE
jgi:RNA polymerase sigma factor (sigma-70 family)